jgi:crossover junction endodeoxyribonuclease RuvC
VFAQSDRRQVVLGIDPGLTRCGYAALEAAASGLGARALTLGVMRTPPTDPLPQRLAALRADLAALMAEVKPDVVVVEHVFFQVNVRTAMSVGQASGLALAEAASRGCEVVQYSPNQVKESIAGWGGADKEQVQRMVQSRLGLTAPPKPADAADAAALALCYLAMAPMRRSVAQALSRQNTAVAPTGSRRQPSAAAQLAAATAAAKPGAKGSHPSRPVTAITPAQARLRILQGGTS